MKCQQLHFLSTAILSHVTSSNKYNIMQYNTIIFSLTVMCTLTIVSVHITQLAMQLFTKRKQTENERRKKLLTMELVIPCCHHICSSLSQATELVIDQSH